MKDWKKNQFAGVERHYDEEGNQIDIPIKDKLERTIISNTENSITVKIINR